MFLISLKKDSDRCIKNKNAPSEKIFNSWCIAPSHTKFSWASQGCGLTFSNLLCVHKANTPTLVYLPGPQLQRLIKVILVKSCSGLFLQVFYLSIFILLSINVKEFRLLGVKFVFSEFSFKWRSQYLIWRLRWSANFWHLGKCF